MSKLQFGQVIRLSYYASHPTEFQLMDILVNTAMFTEEESERIRNASWDALFHMGEQEKE